jgi:hypothetical protein
MKGMRWPLMWFIAVASIFLLSIGVRWIANFALDHDNKWYGGCQLWMVFWVGVVVPYVAGVILLEWRLMP